MQIYEFRSVLKRGEIITEVREFIFAYLFLRLEAPDFLIEDCIGLQCDRPSVRRYTEPLLPQSICSQAHYLCFRWCTIQRLLCSRKRAVYPLHKYCFFLTMPVLGKSGMIFRLYKTVPEISLELSVNVFTKVSMSLFTVSGRSVLALCPAPSIQCTCILAPAAHFLL